nr:DUF374 domain-containing protein [Acetobacter persici]
MRLHVLISRNRDGRLIADIVGKWRIWSIAGSSDTRGKNKGGAAALRGLRSRLRHGGIVAITPDGPRARAERPSKVLRHWLPLLKNRLYPSVRRAGGSV